MTENVFDKDTVVGLSHTDDHKTATISVGRRLAILGAALSPLLVIEGTRYLAFVSDKDCFALWMLLYQALMVVLPFSLAWIAPAIAGFDKRWLPSNHLHWVWFLGMASLLLAGGKLAGWLLLSYYNDPIDSVSLFPIATNVTPTTVLLRGISFILIVPLAEEIFWRAYLLVQLKRSIGHSSTALLVHSALFAFAHLPIAWSFLPVVFFYGMVFGAWRLKFGSLLPLVAAHIVLNGAAVVPSLVTQYEAVAKSYPKHQEIDLLAGQPSEKALPALITFLSDPDDTVFGHALEVLGRDYGTQAEAYLKDALGSPDKRTVQRALFAVGWFGCLSLRTDVRRAAWSSDDLLIQLGAAMTLHELRDQEGLREIAETHPNEKVRHAASRLLKLNRN